MPPDASQRSLRVVFAGGTSGGHLMPGAAAAGALREMTPDVRCLFLLTGRDVEQHCATAVKQFERATVPATPWAGLRQKALFGPRCARAAARILSVFRSFRPHVVVGLGSYNSFVPVVLANALGLRTALFAADTVPGRLVRLLAPLVDRVFLQWHTAARRLVTRHPRVTGIPVRQHLFGADRRTARRRLGLREDVCTMLALGGSQGALAVNRALEGALQRLDGGLQVVHLTGVAHLPDALASPLNEAPWYRPIGFLPRMGDAYAAADFVLSRAGASTLAELTALGLPSILVPYPHHADRHQYINADLLRRAGAALVLNQGEMEERRLLGVIRRLVRDADLRVRMGRNARRLGRPLADRAVARELAALAGFEVAPQRPSVMTSGIQTEHSQAA